MKEAHQITDVGVIVGRFQVPFLHEGHVEVIKHVVDKHPKVVLFLGLSGTGQPTINNTLDVDARQQMINAKFPSIIVSYIKDCREDADWSITLDEKIGDLIPRTQTVTLYGSRESFVARYAGKFPTIELVAERIISGTELRKQAAARAKNSEDFRAGAFWAVSHQFRSVHPTVDVAITDLPRLRILLGRKPHEKLYRFPGGFAEADNATYEDDAIRETFEETGLDVAGVEYLGSRLIDDWRYRYEVNKIKTLFFAGYYAGGAPQANDDLEEVRWFDIKEVSDNLSEILIAGHIGLWTDFLEPWMENQLDDDICHC